jgi:hypothetical protein
MGTAEIDRDTGAARHARGDSEARRFQPELGQLFARSRAMIKQQATIAMRKALVIASSRSARS